MNYILRNITILNILLLAAVVALAVSLITARSPRQNTPLSVTPKTIPTQEEAITAKTAPSMSDFSAVAENNIFHPERRIPPEKKQEIVLPKPELILFGTIIRDSGSVAFIEDKKSPKKTPGRGKRQVVIKKGDVFNGFVVTAIEPDRIRLVRGEENLVVRLMDAGKRRSEVSSNAASTSGSNARSKPYGASSAGVAPAPMQPPPPPPIKPRESQPPLPPHPR
jgi:hypothetical protein